MPLVSFKELMAAAEQGQYAVGYFESWNLESLLAVADAAEATRSPVILGFSGIYPSHPLSAYAVLGLEICRNATVPSCLLFNESPDVDKVLDAIDLGFNLVMFADERLDPETQVARVCQVVKKAHSQSVAVEAEIVPPPGLHENATSAPDTLPFPTDVNETCEYVARTGVDALGVNIGQVHLHGRTRVRLHLDHLAKLKDALDVPLVLHGSSSVEPADLSEAARLGIRKINVGSNLKRAYMEALRKACGQVEADYNPYHVVGSGLPEDVVTAARVAVQETVEELMCRFGSAGRA